MRVTLTYSLMRAGVAVIIPDSNGLDLPRQSPGIDQWIVWKRHTHGADWKMNAGHEVIT
jgi:hypothetical protein